MSSSSSSKVKALQKVVKRLPAQMVYYGSALGAIVLAGGGQLPPGLEFVAGGIGANLLSNLVDEIARGEDVLDDEIRRRAEDAITQSDIANLLTKQDFLQGYARLLKRLDEQRTISQDILDELRTGFSSVATSDQVEELKQLLLQLIDQPTKKFQDKTRVFISYARADDEPFVERLYHDLKDEFDVWWDRVSMPNRGLTFLQEIRDAIDHADRLLLVAGPRAFISDYVRDEWLYAYETYKGINIALRLGDYPDLPKQLSGFDGPDFRSDDAYEERLATLKRQLAEPVAPVGQFYNVPALPPHFLNRPEALATLRDLVIADVDKPTLISAEKRTTAVEGMGGIGKSVMATAFAHDRKVRFAFPDGIVWLTAGHKPSMYELYRAVGVALGDDLSNYPDESTARQNAQKALVDKKCLLILDDVWELPVGRAFRDLISGTSARLLITTRNLQINDVLNANEYRLNLIDESQATHYLRSWVGDDPDLETIAEKLGYLFLALKLAGARMKKDGLSGEDYLRTFDRVSRMKIDRQASDREDSLEASITLSVDAAFANAEDEKLLYHTFGIFPEDTPVPQQTVIQLWRHLRSDVDAFDLLETLNALVDLALLERNNDNRTITLHDLLHSYTREKLGDRYVQTHQDLLDSYRIQQWHELPLNEPYLWWFVAFHLYEADKHLLLAKLLFNAIWLQKKLDVTGIWELLGDFDYVTDKYEIKLIRHALSLSASILDHDPTQLGSQLLGRLIGHKSHSSDIGMFIESLPSIYPQYLIPNHVSLVAAGSSQLQILRGHTSTVMSVCSIPHTDLLLSASEDKTIRLWDTWKGSLEHTFVGHESFVNVLKVTTDGRFAVSGSEDKSVRIWDIDKRELKYTIDDNRLPISAIDISPNNRYLAIGSGYLRSQKDDIFELKIFDLREQKQPYIIGTFDASITSLLFMDDGQKLLVGTINGRASTFDLSTSTEHNSFKFDIGIRDILFKESDGLCVLGGGNGSYAIVDLEYGNIVREFSINTRIIVFKLCLLDDDIICSACSDGKLRFHSYSTGELLGEKVVHSSWVMTFARDTKYLFTGSIDRTIIQWDLSQITYSEISTDEHKHSNTVLTIITIPDNQYTITGSNDNLVKVWEPGLVEVKYTLSEHSGSVTSLVSIMNNTVAVSGGRDGVLVVWDIESGNILRRIHHTHLGFINALRTSHNGTYLLSVTDAIQIWQLPDFSLVHELTGHSDGINVIDITPDDNYLISGEGWTGKDLMIWEIETGRRISKLVGHNKMIKSVKITPDGKYAISGSDDSTIKIWRIPDGELLYSFEMHSSKVESIVCIPSSKLFLSGGSDGEIHLSNWETGEHVSSWERHNGSVFSLSITKDGKYAISGSNDHSLRIWEISSESIIDRFVGESGIWSVHLTEDQTRIVVGESSGRVHLLNLHLPNVQQNQ